MVFYVYFTEKECRKSWTLLRDSFRRALKKQKDTSSGQASEAKRKWKYEDEMSFLIPYFKERRTICTLPSSSEGQVLNDAEENDANDTSEVVSLEFSEASSEYNNPPPPKRRRIHTQVKEQETPSTAIMKYILNNQRSEVQQFFDGISTTVEKFTPRQQAAVKSKVFAIVAEMEIEFLNGGGAHDNIEQLGDIDNYFNYTDC